MFTSLADGIVKRPRLILFCWLLILATAAAGTFTGFGEKPLLQRLHSDAATVPGTESAEVFNLTQTGTSKGPAITALVSGVDLKEPATHGKLAGIVTTHRATIDAIEHTASVLDPFALPPGDPRAQAFIAKDGHGFVVVTNLDASLPSETKTAVEKQVRLAYDAMSANLAKDFPGATVQQMSSKIIGDAILGQTEKDLIRGEVLGLPIALMLMVLVFGGAIAAGLPLIGALTAIIVGMFGLWCFTHVMTLDSFILNVISLIGLALSIDYGLLVVSRFREEAHQTLAERGYPADGSRLPDVETRRQISLDAVRRTSQTAGRTVSFSALTIAFAIVGLLVMTSPILRAIGLGGVLVVVLAVLTSTTLVPALLALIGHKLLVPSPLTKVPVVRSIVAAIGDATTEEGAFSTLARWVHRHPWSVMTGVLAVLVVMCLPLSSLTLRNNFADYIPAESPAKAAYQEMQDKYPALANPEIIVVVDKAPANTADAVQHIKAVHPDITYVSLPQEVAGHPTKSAITVRMTTEDPVGQTVTDVVKELRAWEPGYRIAVGGGAAGQMDFSRSVVDRAPLAGAIMAFAVLTLMFLMTGSVLVPLKALIINVLSLMASLGATWWVFHHGWFGLPQTHGLETFVVACALSFGFGLAMDYEVFLLARIKEYWDCGIGNDAAVEHGLQRSGRIITSAAAIIIAVFVGFIAGDMVAIKQIGVALAIVVLTDATLVRMLLVPSTMTLLGRWNWWAPRWLTAIYNRFKIVH